MSENGKGSKRRPRKVSRRAYDDNWERTFNQYRYNSLKLKEEPTMAQVKREVDATTGEQKDEDSNGTA